MLLFFLTDIDECSDGTDGCDQLCSNNVGSYECVCNAGYRLASDGFTCNGMHIPSVKFSDKEKGKIAKRIFVLYRR